jgi:hypothetical protein
VRSHRADLREVRRGHFFDALVRAQDAVDPTRLKTVERLCRVHGAREIVEIQDIPASAMDADEGRPSTPGPDGDERTKLGSRTVRPNGVRTRREHRRARFDRGRVEKGRQRQVDAVLAPDPCEETDRNE